MLKRLISSGGVTDVIVQLGNKKCADIFSRKVHLIIYNNSVGGRVWDYKLRTLKRLPEKYFLIFSMGVSRGSQLF